MSALRLARKLRSGDNSVQFLGVHVTGHSCNAPASLRRVPGQGETTSRRGYYRGCSHGRRDANCSRRCLSFDRQTGPQGVKLVPGQGHREVSSRIRVAERGLVQRATRSGTAGGRRKPDGLGRSAWLGLQSLPADLRARPTIGHAAPCWTLCMVGISVTSISTPAALACSQIGTASRDGKYPHVFQLDTAERTTRRRSAALASVP